MNIKSTIKLLTFLIISQLSYGQVDYNVAIQNIEELPKAKLVRHKKQTKQYSRYNIIGATNTSIIIQETVKVYAKSSYIYDFDNEVILHFYEKTGNHNLKKSQSIWKQTRQNHAGSAVQATAKLNNEDLVPNLYVLNNIVYAISANYYKRYSDNPKLKAAPVTIIKETGDQIIIKKKLLYADVSNYAKCSLLVSVDSSFFYSVSKKFLKKADKKNFSTAIRTYDDNLEVKDYIPLNNWGRFYVSSSKTIQIHRITKGKSESIKVKVIDMKDQSIEEQEISIGSFARNYGGFIDHYQLLDFNENSARVLIGNTCVTCGRGIKKLLLATVNINFDSDTELAIFHTVDVEAIAEDEDSDQSEFQTAFYNALANVDISDKSVGAESLIEVQYKPGISTSSVKYVRSIYMVTTPILIHHQTEEGTRSLALNRAMNNYGYNKHLPLVIGHNDDVVLLLSNFSVPEVSDDDIKMYASSSQVLEFSIVDLESNTVYRENISGALEANAKNDLHKISPSQPLILGRSLLCITKTQEEVFYLSKLTW